MDYTSQPFPFEDPQFQANVKSWNVSAMNSMAFLDQVPKCGSSNWNQWNMNDLVDATNANFPNRISPEMKAELLDVEVQVGESWGPWGAIQRTLLQSLSSAVERKSILNSESINAHTDCFCYNHAMKRL